MFFAELSQATEQNAKINPKRGSKAGKAIKASRRSSMFSSNNPYRMEHKRHLSKDSSTGSMMSRKHPLRGSQDISGIQRVEYEYEPYIPSTVELPETPSTPSYPAAFSYIARFLNQSGYLSTPFQSNEFLPNPPPKDRKSTDILKWLGGNRRSRISVVPTENIVTPPSPSATSSPEGPFYSATDLPFASATDLSSALDPIPNQHHYQNMRFRGASLFRLDESLSEQDSNEIHRDEPIIQRKPLPEQTHIRHHSEPIARKPLIVHVQHKRNQSEPFQSLSPLPEQERHASDSSFTRVGQFSEDFSPRSDVQYKPAVIFLPKPDLVDEKARERNRLSKEQKLPKTKRQSVKNLRDNSARDEKMSAIQSKKDAAEAKTLKKEAAKEAKRSAKTFKKESVKESKRRSRTLEEESVMENRKSMKSIGQHSMSSKDTRNKLKKEESVRSRHNSTKEKGNFKERGIFENQSVNDRNSKVEKDIFTEKGVLKGKSVKDRNSKMDRSVQSSDSAPKKKRATCSCM